MANAGYLTTVHVSDDNGVSWTPVGGINDVSWDPKSDELDTSEFNTGSSSKTSMLGADSGTAQLQGDFKGADAGQTKIRTAKTAKTHLQLRYLADGVNGFKVDCTVPTVSLKSSFGGKATTTFSFTMQAVPTPVP